MSANDAMLLLTEYVAECQADGVSKEYVQLALPNVLQSFATYRRIRLPEMPANWVSDLLTNYEPVVIAIGENDEAEM